MESRWQTERHPTYVQYVGPMCSSSERPSRRASVPTAWINSTTAVSNKCDQASRSVGSAISDDRLPTSGRLGSFRVVRTSPRSVVDRTRPCEGRRPGSTPGEDNPLQCPEPIGLITDLIRRRYVE